MTENPEQAVIDQIDALVNESPSRLQPRRAVIDHDFRPVAGHPDDDECTYRSDGTDATYCGLTRDEHGT